MGWWRRWNAKVVEAICLSDCDAIEDLHRRGVSLRATTKSGETYLHRAAVIRSNRSGEMAETLIRFGAEVNTSTKYRFRPLHTAVIACNLAVVEVLLNHNADIHAKSRFGFTALHYAVSQEQRTIAELLLKHGANPHLMTEVGDTAFCIAERNPAGEIAELLRFPSSSKSNGNERTRVFLPVHKTHVFH
ncbi:MAG: ankyrin repeat domain-containing protein [Fimbriiglobus sp.]